MAGEAKRCCVLLASLLAGAAHAAATGEDAPAASAARAFENLKALAGSWQATSTNGWTGRTEIRVIAGGSAILATSVIGPHGDETMATVYHLDGDRLVLTHYCVAGNQPRLESTAISDGARRIELAFRDGTNLASRNVGHMDRVWIEIEDASRWRSRWTWYQDGEERWLEEIEHTRAGAEQDPGADGSHGGGPAGEEQR
jgi:hypothetical protein